MVRNNVTFQLSPLAPVPCRCRINLLLKNTLKLSSILLESLIFVWTFYYSMHPLRDIHFIDFNPDSICSAEITQSHRV